MADSSLLSKLLLLPLYPLAYIVKLYRTASPRPLPALPHLLTSDGVFTQAWRGFSRIHEDRITYCEDLVIWHKHGIAILSTEPSRPVFNPFTAKGNHKASDNGKLQVYNLDSGELQDVSIEGWPTGRALHPLGINLLQSAENGNEAILGIANCPEGPCSIELLRLVYDNDAGKLSACYIRSLEHPSIGSPNAVVVLSENEVLFTNSFGVSPRTSHFLNTVEQTLAIPGGSVKLISFADGKVSCTTLISKIPLANGLALSSDGKLLAVASTMGQYVSLYDVADGFKKVRSAKYLKHRKDVPLGFLPDNLQFVENGSENPFSDAAAVEKSYTLLCAGHPSGLEFLATAKKPINGPRAPSRVVKISIPRHPDPSPSLIRKARNLFASKGEEVQMLFESRGEFFATSSTAAAFTTMEGKQAMLVCGLWEKGLLRCENIAIQ